MGGIFRQFHQVMEHSKLQTTENGILESKDTADVLFKDDLVLPSEEV